METVREILHNFLLLFAMVNAIGNLPLFADLTAGMSGPVRSRTFRVAVVTGGAIVLCFAVFGDVMLRYVFDVSMPAFKIAGGILVFIVAARGVILGSKGSVPGVEGGEQVAVFPLGFPYLAGPGTILTTILLLQTSGHLLTVVTVVLVYLSILPLLRLAALVERAIGKIGVIVVSRILYIFICAKAVSFVLDGLRIPL